MSWFRSSIILQVYLALLFCVAWLSVLFLTVFHSGWLACGVVPVSFLPVAIVGARFAQRLDVQKKDVFWIAAPSMITMALVSLFSLFVFSSIGARALQHWFVAMIAIVFLAGVTTAFYVRAERMAFRDQRGEKNG